MGDCLCKFSPAIKLDPQSGNGYRLGPSVHKEQNVVFSDQMSSYVNEMENVLDPTRTQQDTHDAELADFFARPVKLKEYEWAVGSTFFRQFNPWSLYLENPRVSNRIANFNLLRCKLHLKFVINANGFMYSRILTSYLPFQTWDNLTETSVLFPNDAVQESQMPHIFLNPTTSTGGEMVLPFVWPRNNVYIPSSEWEHMGRVTLRSLAPLKHANGATGVATISVFAWAEDMSLNVLTSVDPSSMTPQMGFETEVDQANRNGAISGPATAVANAATALSAVPQIAPYAMATASVANTVAGVAKLAGFSRPVQTRDNNPVRLNATSNLALTTIADTAQKLTVDDKQELTIDPRIAGLNGEDNLAIKNIASKESYLTSFDWAVGSAPETLLWNGRVDPCTFAYDGIKYHLPACCVAALPFKYWTGTMNFRFQIMSSAYHKGRLKISYDPNWVANEEYNTMYTRVVDISSETDFTISVSNGQDVTLLSHHLPGPDSVTQLYSTTRYISKEEGNGVLAVSILNELTTPNSTINNDITINVFVSMGDDFEVFVPTEDFGYYTFAPQMSEPFVIEPQSSKPEVTPDSFSTQQDEPEHSEAVSIGPTISSLDKINTVFTGESIKSFRQMLKRYSLHTSYATLTAGDRQYTIRSSYFPFLRGNVPDAIHQTALATPYNYCNTLLLHWIVNCFSGWRGSIRYKMKPTGYLKINDRIMAFHVERGFTVPGQSQYQESNVGLPSYTSHKNAAHNSVLGSGGGLQKTFGAKGQTFALSTVNPIVEVEIPYYSENRFVPGKISNYTGINTTQIHQIPAYECSLLINSNSLTTIDFHVAVGEDFATYFWTGCPPVYYEASPPAA